MELIRKRKGIHKVLSVFIVFLLVLGLYTPIATTQVEEAAAAGALSSKQWTSSMTQVLDSRNGESYSSVGRCTGYVSWAIRHPSLYNVPSWPENGPVDELEQELIDRGAQRVSLANAKAGDIVVFGSVHMAILGALTTPGSSSPLAIIDMGAGSTDASLIDKNGKISYTHLAGAGNMVTLLINSELGLDDLEMAERIKKYPLAKVESIFHIRHEDGTVQFFKEPLDPKLFARVVVVEENNFVPIESDIPLEKIRIVRRSAKEKVFVFNSIRALETVSTTGNIRDIPFVVLVGGSSLDFEIPQMVMDALSHYKIVAGRGNIRGKEGPRNAVATGLILDYVRSGGNR